MPKLKSYHFSVGNSSTGPIGLCARIEAGSKKEAVARLAQAFSEILGGLGEVELHPRWEGRQSGEYICAYLNPDALRPRQIDEVNESLAEDTDAARTDDAPVAQLEECLGWIVRAHRDFGLEPECIIEETAAVLEAHGVKDPLEGLEGWDEIKPSDEDDTE